MIIKHVVTLAKYSELAGVAVKNDIDAIVAFMNLGMIELYKRFNIKVEEHVINLSEDSVYYEMPSNFMYAIEAYGETDRSEDNAQNPIGINDEDDPSSIFFTDWNTVQVPFSVSGGYISINYAAKPENITSEQAEDGVSELQLPDVLMECLLSYIGFRGYLGVKSDAQSENNAHWARFERSCKKVIELGLANPADSMSMSSRISERGFE